MLVMLFLWLYLTVVTFPLGLLVIAMTGNGTTVSALPLWTGLAAQMVLLQIVAVFVPLYPAALFIMPLVAALAALARRRDLIKFVDQWRLLPAASLAAIGILSVAIAYVAAGPITYYDSGLYHIQLLRWLARDGVVPGLGLFEPRFGIPSDWFALAAPFDAGPLQGRMAACANAYVVLLMALQSLFCWARVFSGQSKPGDALLAASFGLLILHAFWVDTILSASPDLPLAVFTVIIGWLIAGGDDRAPHRLDRGHCALVAFLASMTVTLKLSGAPILIVGGLYCLWQSRRSVASLFKPALLSAAVLAPSVYTSVVLSGCPAFPLAVGCFDLPWTVPAEAAITFQQSVTRFARWYASPQQGNGAFDWIVPYFIDPGNRVNPPLVALAFLSTMTVLVSAVMGRVALGSARWVLALALADFVFVMIAGPDTRFCIGAIALLFGQAFATIASSSFADRRLWRAHSYPSSRGAFALGIIGALGLIVFRVAIVDRVVVRRWKGQSYGQVLSFHLHRSPLARLVLPVPLPVVYGVTRTRDGHLVDLAVAYSGDVTYGEPPFSDQCWGTNELCTPDLTTPLRFRVPERGASSGFVRIEP